MSEQPQQQGTAQTSVDMGYSRPSNSSPNSYANTLSSSNTDPQIVMESIEERPVAVAEENNRANMDNRIIVGELKEAGGRTTDPILQSPSVNPSGCEEIKAIGNVIRGSGCIIGTNNEDFIQAIPNASSPNGDVDNIIFGKDKPDVIFSDVGIDTVYGGSGGDTIQGGPGNDQIFGKGGDDHLFGGSDDDLIIGGKGNNHRNYGSLRVLQKPIL